MDPIKNPYSPGAGSPPPESLVPPKLLENPMQLVVESSRIAISGKTPEELKAEFFKAQHDHFCDTSLPALDGRTPRQAAQDPSLRPTLLRLMKSRIRTIDEESSREGQLHDLN